MNRALAIQESNDLEREIEELRRSAENLRAQANDFDMLADKKKAGLEVWKKVLSLWPINEDIKEQITSDLAGLELSVGNAVEDVCPQFTIFTRPQLVAAIRAKFPKLDFADDSIRKPLNSLVDRKLVEQIRESAGTKGNLYRWIGR